MWTGAAEVQRVGKIIVLWRPTPLDDSPAPQDENANDSDHSS